MKNCLTKGIALCLFFLFLCSCSTTTPFVYDQPQPNTSSLTNIRIAILTQKDERQPNEETDKMWSSNPLGETAKIIEQEIRSCGLFQEVISAPNPDQEKVIMKRNDIRMFLRPTLKDLSWSIPTSQEQEDTELLVSILTSGISDLVNEADSTNFYGSAKIRVVLEDRKTSKIILDKEYASRAEEKITRFRTDSYEERARIIGKAFKQVMEQLKADLGRVINTTLEKKR